MFKFICDLKELVTAQCTVYMFYHPNRYCLVSFSSKQLIKSVTFQIYILHSDDIIGIDVQPQVIWDYKLNEISLSIKQTYTTDDTRQLTIKQRRCVFEDEIKLKGMTN